jgi:hypothetical protein
VTTVSELTYLTQDQLVANMTTAYGGSLGILPNLLEGDPELAIFEGTATQGGWLQYVAQLIWTAARASTATGSDLDSFVNDFGLTRLPATFAQGPVTLIAPSAPVVQVLIYPGALVQTPGGAIQYSLVADATQPAWNATLGAYVLPAGQTSITATAQATVAGSVDNVQPGQLTQLASSIAGIGSVTNGAAITNGLNQESDPALRVRFVQFLASLSKATVGAVLFAINSVQQGLDILPIANVNINLTPTPGTNLVIVDDGTGSPSSTLLNNCLTAVNNIRAYGIQFYIKGPTVIATTVALSLLIVPNPTESNAVIQSNVQVALVNYVNAVQLSAGSQYLYLNDIISIATDADPNVLAVVYGSALLNGVAADLEIGTGGLPRTTLSGVTVSIP